MITREFLEMCIKSECDKVVDVFAHGFHVEFKMEKDYGLVAILYVLDNGCFHVERADISTTASMFLRYVQVLNRVAYFIDHANLRPV
jgi:hypothetical protein